MHPEPDQRREWFSVEDPEEERTWVFDVTFLTSRWTCIYGRGCPGIAREAAPEKAIGCCNHGAWLSDADDRGRVEQAAARLDDEQWQYRGLAARKGAIYTDRKGDLRTRRVDGACIFLNRAGFGAGAGCALHQLAQAEGRSYLETKPEVCWQAPIRREDHTTAVGHVMSMVREWRLRDWGGDPDDFGWWCTESADAHVGSEPAYVSLREELEAICGSEVYRSLARYLDRRGTSVFLPHPAVRHRA